MLAFHFPQAAQAKYAREIGQIEGLTGWAVQIKPEPHLGALEQFARSLLPPDWTLSKQPSTYFEQAKMALTLEPCQADPDALAGIQAAFEAETGFRLEIGMAARPRPSLPGSQGEKLEINQAYAWIREAFAGCPHALYKTSLKGMPADPHIELSFFSPQIGVRYRELIDRLEAEIGWRLRFTPCQAVYALLSKFSFALEHKSPCQLPKKSTFAC